MRIAALAAAIGAIGAAALFAWEYGTRQADRKARIEYLRAQAQNHSERQLVVLGLLKQAGDPPVERCAWPRHCRSELLKAMYFRGTEITVVLVDGRQMVITPRHAGAPGERGGWKCVSDLPDELRPALCSTLEERQE